MHRALVVSILVVGAAFLALSAVIIVNKAWREVREGWRRIRRKALEPRILAYAHGEEKSLLPALGGRLTSPDRGVVEEILLDYVERVRGIERERLQRVLDELGYVDRYLAALRSVRWWRRARAAERLGLAGAARAATDLAALLDDRSADVRLRAAKSLGAVGGKAAALPLIATLREPNRFSSIRIADILADMGPRVLADLQIAFPGLNRPAKLAVLDIAGRIRAIDSVPWLARQLEDVDADVRARACDALGSVGDPACGPQLVARLSDGAWPARAMAAKALGRIRHQPAIDGLCAALRDKEWWVRANAAEALLRIGPAGLDALEKMLEDPDLFARHQAVLMLEQSGRLDRIAAALASDDGGARAEATRKLRLCLRTGQSSRLEDLSSRHAGAGVREALLTLLASERPQSKETPA